MQLEIKGLGPISGKKNRRKVRGGKIVTDPECAHQMEAIIQHLMLQLYAEFQRQKGVGEIATILPLASWTACVLPQDDSVSWIPSLSVSVEYVEPHQEGALIVVKPI